MSKCLRRLLFVRPAALAKAEQLGLFDIPVNVKPSIRKDGTVVRGHVATRKKRLAPKGKQPDLFGAAAPKDETVRLGRLGHFIDKHGGYRRLLSLLASFSPAQKDTLLASMAKLAGKSPAAILDILKTGARHEGPAAKQDDLFPEPVVAVGGDEKANAEPKPAAFTPTHELPDGTQVIAHADEASVWVDAQGDEYESEEAYPIEAERAIQVEPKKEQRQVNQLRNPQSALRQLSAETDRLRLDRAAAMEAFVNDGGERLRDSDQPAGSFGVPPGTTKGARRKLNAACIDILQKGDITDADRETLRQYSGNGGCGDSLNEFYTSPEIATSMWQVVNQLGITGGTVLEPASGPGVFLHTAIPGVRVTAVELDPTSANIAQVLHGDRHEIHNASLERFATSDDRQFDAVIGNAPFGPRGALLGDDKRDLGKAEEYFLDTALDKTKPMGIVAMIVPTGIMDSKNGRAFRERLLRKAEFLGAQRMPNSAFEHSHTDVTTDVVYFRKRPDAAAGALSVVDRSTLQTLGVWDDEFLSGTYFEGRGAGNLFGRVSTAKRAFGEIYTVEGSMQGIPEALREFAPHPVSTAPDIVEILAALTSEKAKAAAMKAAETRPYANTAKVGDTKVVDGVTYVLQGQPPRWHRVDEANLSEAVIEGAELAYRIDGLMEGQDVDRGQLQADIQAWVARYGLPSKNANLMIAAAADKTLYRLIGAVGKDGELSDAVRGVRRQIEGSMAAVAHSLALSRRSGVFTAEELAATMGKEADEIQDHLAADPEFAWTGADQWTTRKAYLTGELWPKLDAARAALESEETPAYLRDNLKSQIQALEDTIGSKPLDDVDIAVNSAFIPLDIVSAYFTWKDQEGPNANKWTREQKPVNITFEDGVYTITGGSHWGMRLVDKYLNRSGVKKDEIDDINAMNEDFKAWLCQSEYREQVEELYNRKFLGFVEKDYSQEPIEVPGLANQDQLRDYQWPGLRWALERGKGIIAADVGLGKTLRGLLLARMAKLNGSAQKPIIVVPKSVLANWYAETQKWFPGSRVLTIGGELSQKDGAMIGKDDNAAERKRKYHDLSQNDYDFVLISEPAFEELDLDPVKKKQMHDRDFWVQRGDKLGNAGDKTVRKIRENYEQAIAKRDIADRTDAMYFNGLGVDMIIQDEMHHCFPPGTLIDGIPVEELKEGDIIKSFNHQSGHIEMRPVVAVAAMPANRLCRVTLCNGQSIVSTDNHRFFTLQSGYVEAAHLNGSCDVIINTTRTEGSPDGNDLQRMRRYVHPIQGAESVSESGIGGLLHEDVFSHSAPPEDDAQVGCELQLQPLSSSVHAEPHAAMENGKGQGNGVLLQSELCGEMEGGAAGGARLAAHTGDTAEAQRGAEGAQLVTDARGAGTKDEGFAEYGSDQSGRSTDTRREWQAGAGSAADAGRGIDLDDGACGGHAHAEGQRLSKPLQDRHSQSGHDDCHRSGWEQPQFERTAAPGSEEGSVLVVARVVRVEILEPGSDGEFERLCPEGLVYDIEVADNHNFFAEGVLVHNSKNLYAARSRFGESPKFLGGQGQSQRALDFNLKARWLLENNGNKGVYGLTATPTKNSPLEIYSMLSHIAPEAFENIGIRNSEEFLDRFAMFERGNILDTKSDIIEALITAGFKNLGELRSIMNRYIDRTTAEDVGLKLPGRDDRMHFLDMTDEQKAVYDDLRQQLIESASKKDATGDAHIFSIMDKMNKAALDLEILEPETYAGASSPKYDKLAANLMEFLPDGGQVVFSDFIASHEKIAQALVQQGIPRNQIGIINAQVASSSAKRQQIADAFNAGKLRVVIGNTATMGEGINLQKSTTDIHHLDLPWEPASMQQRNGRGLRQGNINEAVRIHTYLAKGSFDGYRYQSIAAKKDWQDILWHGADRVENLAMSGQLSRDDLMIMMSADPEAERAKREADQEGALSRLAAQRTEEANGEFVRFQSLKASFKALKSKENKTAALLQDRIAKSRNALRGNKYFKAKSALDMDEPVLLHPVTGDIIMPGMRIDLGDGAWVVTAVDVPKQTATARRFGQSAAVSTTFKVHQDSFRDAVVTLHDEQAENAEIRERMEREAAEKPIASMDDLYKLPRSYVEANQAQLQRTAWEGAATYKFSTRLSGASDRVPLVNLSTGKPEWFAYWDIGKTATPETHRFLLPTDADQALAEQAWLNAERTMKHATRLKPSKRRRDYRHSNGDWIAARKYAEASATDESGRNPWTGVLSAMAGEKSHYYGEDNPSIKAMKKRFAGEQVRSALKAKTFREALDHLAPLGEYDNPFEGPSTKVLMPTKGVMILWAKAKREGILDQPIEAHLPQEPTIYNPEKMQPKHSPYFVRTERSMGGFGGKPITVREALLKMATDKRDDKLVAILNQHDPRKPS